MMESVIQDDDGAAKNKYVIDVVCALCRLKEKRARVGNWENDQKCVGVGAESRIGDYCGWW